MRGIDIIDVVSSMLKADASALLCDIEWCPFCLRARALVEG
jgi:hypothetical protein